MSMPKQTRFTHEGLAIVVTDAHVANATAEVDAVSLSLAEAFDAANVGVSPEQLDVTVDGEGTYFFTPRGALQEALEGLAHGTPIAAGEYVADLAFDERGEES